MKRLILIVISSIISSAVAAPTVLADSPDKERKEAYKEQMKNEREEMKRQQELEREDQKKREEMKRERRKDRVEMEREERKHQEEDGPRGA